MTNTLLRDTPDGPAVISVTAILSEFQKAVEGARFDEIESLYLDGIEEAFEAASPGGADTALLWLASWKSQPSHLADVAGMLIELGADPKAKGGDGLGVLPRAAMHGASTAFVGVLIDNGVDVDDRAPNGTTSLAMAVIRRNAEVATLLLSRGANPNAQDWDSEVTPLFWAVDFHADEMIGILLAHGADPLIRNAAGETVVDMVRDPSYPCSRCRDQIETFLQKKGLLSVSPRPSDQGESLMETPPGPAADRDPSL